MSSGFETGQSVGSTKASFGGTVSIRRRSPRFIKYRREIIEKRRGRSATLTGCELDGKMVISTRANKTAWRDVTGARSAESVSDGDTTSGALTVGKDRTKYSSARFYFRFDGSNFASGIRSVSNANLQVYVSALTNTSDADANKWKAFEHDDVSTRSLATGDWSTYDSDTSGTETTVTAGGYVTFPLTGDLLTYIQTQAAAQADVALVLICKLEYDSTAPTGTNNTINVSFTESRNDPKLTYTYA
tara:strand:- start:257 stop:991 length:735 start_codon:yes stop_codon:yes gene_type:complete